MLEQQNLQRRISSTLRYYAVTRKERRLLFFVDTRKSGRDDNHIVILETHWSRMNKPIDYLAINV